MKKAIVLALAVILTLGLAVPAAAVGSPVAPSVSDKTTAPLPEVVEAKTEDGAVVVVEAVAAEDTANLGEEAKATFVAAQASLASAAPAGMKTQYFFFVKITASGDKAPTGAVSMTVKVDNVAKAVVKQFVDGKWIELETVVNADGTITIKGVVEGPIAIFTE